MTKIFGILILCMLIFSLSVSLVSAAGSKEVVTKISEGVSNIYGAIEPLLRFVVGGEADDAGTFFAKLLFLVIVLSIIYLVLDKINFFSENKIVLWSLSIIASLLSMKWLGNAEIVQSIILPYSALGISLSSGFPFILVYLVVKDFPKPYRKVSWIFFSVIFIGLWTLRYPDEIGNFSFIYLAAAFGAFLMFWFDSTISSWKLKAKSEKVRSATTSRLLDKINDDIRDADERFARGEIDITEHNKRIKAEHKKLKQLSE